MRVLRCCLAAMICFSLLAVACKKSDSSNDGIVGSWQLKTFDFYSAAYNRQSLDTSFSNDEHNNYDTAFCTLTFMNDSCYAIINGQFTGGRYTAVNGMLRTKPAYFGGYLFDSSSYSISGGELHMHRRFITDQAALRYLSNSDWTFKKR